MTGQPAWLILGGSRGIGAGLVEACLSRGYPTLATYRAGRPGALTALEDAYPDQLHLFECDVASDDSVRALAAATDGLAIGTVIFNAGVFGKRTDGFAGSDTADMMSAFNVNALGFVRTLDAFAGRLEGERRHITAITSLFGSNSKPGQGPLAYRASKAALNRIITATAPELKARGVTLTAFRPGWVRTEMNGMTGDVSPRESGEGIVRTLEAAGPDASGTLLDYTGITLDW